MTGPLDVSRTRVEGCAKVANQKFSLKAQEVLSKYTFRRQSGGAGIAAPFVQGFSTKGAWVMV